MLFSVTREVSLDGMHQYSSIQTAVNACASGDIILVFPGRYVENINLNSHDITIASMYAHNPIQSNIDNTIIDGNLNTCVTVESGETVTVNGFTLVNNEQNNIQNNYTNGGAFYIWNSSHVFISNCIIRNCSALYGGGIFTRLNSIIEFSNTDIHSNQSIGVGGGILSSTNSQLIWDSTHPSSVYNNVAAMGMDFYINECTEQINIQLAMGSIATNEADNFFVVYTDNSAQSSVSIAQGCFVSIDSDIYVSPTGSDNNNGLTAFTPYKTVTHALQMIDSNPDNPRTIHLAAGTYSYSTNGQILPVALKSHVRLVGAGTEITIIDGDFQDAFLGAYHITDAIVSDISFQNCRASSFITPINIYNSHDIVLRNLVFMNNSNALSSGINLSVCHDIVMENITVGYTEIGDDIYTISAYSSDNIYINNVLSTGNSITNRDYNFLGFFFDESDIVLRNTIISNNAAQDAFALYYQNTRNEQSVDNLDMSNVLIVNNTISQCSWAFAPVYLQNRYQRMKINNCTFAGNHGAGNFSMIFAYADVSNLISYNPGFSSELYLKNDITGEGIQADVTLSNNLFRTAAVYSDLPNLITLTDNIFNGNPLFLGDVVDSLEVTDPEYYYLSAGSPCINTGTADTTGLNLPLTDLAGNYRIWDNRIDMGCFEYGSESVTANDNPEYPSLPDKIVLSTYPNPVYLNGSKGAYTFIEFTLPEKAKDKPVVEIYNLKGQRVRTMQVGESFNSMVGKAGLNSDELRTKDYASHSLEEPVLDQIGEGNPGSCRVRYSDKENSMDSCLRRNDTTFYSTVFDCRDDRSQRLATGLYIVKVTSGRHQTSTKITILK